MTLVGSLAAMMLIFSPASPARGAMALMGHAAATSQLAAAGIPWTSSGECSDRYNPECTSFEQIRQTSIDGIITLQSASGCPIMITGGTETGHGTGTYTHWNGWKIDISRWDCVSAYIDANFAYVGYLSGWGHQYRAPSGNLYTDEGDHWDILYYTCGGCTVTAESPAEPAPKASSPPAQPGPEPEPSGPPIVDPPRIADHRG